MKKLLSLALILLISGCTIPDLGFRLTPEEDYQIRIKWLGHAGFLIETNRTRVYINPYSAAIGSLKGDAILVSNSASDLCNLDDINTLSKEKTIIITPPECLARLAMSNIIPLEIGREYRINEVLINTVDAYNINGSINKGSGAGFLIQINNTIIYYAGVTDLISEMDSISGVNVLIFPIAGGELSMNMFEAVELMQKVGSEHNIPMYYGGNTGTSLDVGREMKSIARANGYNVTLLHNEDLKI